MSSKSLSNDALDCSFVVTSGLLGGGRTLISFGGFVVITLGGRKSEIGWLEGIGGFALGGCIFRAFAHDDFWVVNRRVDACKEDSKWC